MQKFCLAVVLSLLEFLVCGGSQSRVSPRIPKELLGSAAVLARQNALADQYLLRRIRTDAELDSLVHSGYLTPVPDMTPAFYLDPKEVLRRNRYILPFAKRFLEELGEKYARQFLKPLKVVSLVRSEAYHRELVRRGITDADTRTPDRRSIHPTGAAFDISKLGLSNEQVEWLRTYLVGAKRAGRVEATEEKVNNNFHIFVLPPVDANRIAFPEK